jgi:hypothetical protein
VTGRAPSVIERSQKGKAMLKVYYIAKGSMRVAGEVIDLNCEHHHSLMAKAVECVWKLRKRGGFWQVQKVCLGCEVELSDGERRSVRAGYHYYKIAEPV